MKIKGRITMLGAVDTITRRYDNLKRRQIVVAFRESDDGTNYIEHSLSLTLENEWADKELEIEAEYMFDLAFYVDMFNGRMFNRIRVTKIDTL